MEKEKSCNKIKSVIIAIAIVVAALVMAFAVIAIRKNQKTGAEEVPTATPVPTQEAQMPADEETPEPTEVAQMPADEEEPVPAVTDTPVPTAAGTPTPEPTPAPHVHVYAEKIKKEPTYANAGIKTFTCECGDKYDEKIPALGYTYTDMELELYVNAKTKAMKQPNDSSGYWDYVIFGAKVRVTGKCNEVDWYRIEFRGTDAYVKAARLVEENPVPTPAPAPVEQGDTLFDVPLYGIISTDYIFDSEVYLNATKEMENRTVEKITYECSTGDKFCIWNLRLEQKTEAGITYWWFIAPQGDEFTSGQKQSAWTWSPIYEGMEYDKDDIIEQLEKYAIQFSEEYNAEFAEARIGYVSDKPKYPQYVFGEVFPYELLTVMEDEEGLYFWYRIKGHAFADCTNEECEFCTYLPVAKQVADQKYGEGWYVIRDLEKQTIFEDYVYFRCSFIPIV